MIEEDKFLTLKNH